MWNAILRMIKIIRGKYLESKNNFDTDSNFAKKKAFAHLKMFRSKFFQELPTRS